MSPEMERMLHLASWFGSTAALLGFGWYLLTPAKQALGWRNEEAVLKPGRKYMPLVVSLWFAALGCIVPAAIYVQWRSIELGLSGFTFWDLINFSAGLLLMAYLMLFVARTRLFVSSRLLRHRPMLGPIQQMAWSDLVSARWSSLHDAILLTDKTGLTMKVKAHHDGFVGFLCDYSERIDAIQPLAIPQKWRQKVVAFRAARIQTPN